MFYRILKRAFATAVILTTCACQSTSQSDFPRSAADTDPYALLLRAEQAASVRQQVRLRQQAARALLESGDFAGALDVLNLLLHSREHLDADALDEIQRLRARAALPLGDTTTAAAAFEALRKFEPEDYLLLARVCAAQDQPGCVADALIQAELAFGYGAENLPADLHDQIWRALNRARTAPTTFVHRYHHGWWTLQQSLREAGSIPDRLGRWQRWRARFPSHPAALAPPAQIEQLEQYAPPSIALLLPLSGALASAGKATRDGFIAAYLAEPGADKPPVHVYDTEANRLEDIWQAILDQGIDVTVGPLLKARAEAFAALTAEAPVPRLMLNYLDTGPQAGLYQIGIAIEDEAASLAQHVHEQGYERVLLVHSEASWSQRARAEFLRQWPWMTADAGFEDIQGLTEAVGGAMQVASSQTRQQELVGILGEQIEFLPRARRDLDAVVALTSQIESRALVPALRFHFADHLQVFATSQAIRGPDTTAIGTFLATEMPLLSTPDFRDMSIALGTETSRFAELHALGFDAYRVATWLPLVHALPDLTLPGASGYLWLDQGAFHRELDLTRVGTLTGQ